MKGLKFNISYYINCHNCRSSDVSKREWRKRGKCIYNRIR